MPFFICFLMILAAITILASITLLLMMSFVSQEKRLPIHTTQTAVHAFACFACGLGNIGSYFIPTPNFLTNYHSRVDLLLGMLLIYFAAIHFRRFMLLNKRSTQKDL